MAGACRPRPSAAARSCRRSRSRVARTFLQILRTGAPSLRDRRSRQPVCRSRRRRTEGRLCRRFRKRRGDRRLRRSRSRDSRPKSRLYPSAARETFRRPSRGRGRHRCRRHPCPAPDCPNRYPDGRRGSRDCTRSRRRTHRPACTACHRGSCRCSRRTRRRQPRPTRGVARQRRGPWHDNEEACGRELACRDRARASGFSAVTASPTARPFRA